MWKEVETLSEDFQTMAKRKDAPPVAGGRFVREQPHVFQCISCYWYLGCMKCRSFKYESMEPDIPIEIIG